MLIDYHMHTYLSDGRDTHDQMLASAAFRGMGEIGFSDHVCLKPVKWALSPHQVEQMVVAVQSIQQSNTTPVSIKFGVEMDYFPGQEKEIEEVLNSLPLDYVIGSVHFVDDWNFDTNSHQFDMIDVDQFYRRYFQILQQSAQSGLFDIIGHCDLAKKFAYYPSFALDELYDQTARIFKESDVAVEINTSGRTKPCNEFYPAPCFIQRLVHHKVPIALGSDAHVEQNIGQFFDDALATLNALGVTKIARFTKRRREMVSFD